MDEIKFHKLTDSMSELTPAQFKELVLAYAEKTGQNSKEIWEGSIYAISEHHLQKIGVNSCCPECGSVSIVHNGFTSANIQRYQCADCKKMFTRFTGTLLEKSRYPWEVWVEVLRMVLNGDSLDTMKTRLEKDFSCEGINRKTLFYMRLKLIYSMANMPSVKLNGIIQMDETFVRESQKGRNLELVSYLKGQKRKPRYGRQPSKLGTLGPEFATILTAIDEEGYCVCKVVSLGKATIDHAVDLLETYCNTPAYICTDANVLYTELCDLLEIPHYIKASNYATVLSKNLLTSENCTKKTEEIVQHNQRTLEKLYKDGLIDRIEHREDLTYTEFKKIKKAHKLNLARVNELHADIKLMIEKKMTNVSTKYLSAYMDFFTYRRNWRVEHGHYPTSTRDAETILAEILPLKIAPTNKELDAIMLNLPKPTGRAMQILKDKTEMARVHTRNKYFKYDEEDIPCFNKREILRNAPRTRLIEIARTYKIKGYTKMDSGILAYNIALLPNIEDILIDLITEYRHYELAEEDIKYLQSLKYRTKKV